MSMASLGLFPGPPAQISIQTYSCEGGAGGAARTAEAVTNIIASRPVLRLSELGVASLTDVSWDRYDGKGFTQQHLDATALTLVSCLTACLGILSAAATSWVLIRLQRKMRPSVMCSLQNLARRRMAAIPKSISMQVLVATLHTVRDSSITRLLALKTHEPHFLVVELGRALRREKKFGVQASEVQMTTEMDAWHVPRALVAQALGRLGATTAAAVADLQMALTDADWHVRLTAAQALGGLGAAAAPAVGDLAHTSLRDENWHVRKAAAEALGRLGVAAAPAVGELQMALRDEDWHVRRAAGEALAGLGAAAAPAVGDLQTALRDEDGHVRRAAAEALGRLGATAPAVGELKMALKDDDVDVRRAAAKALDGLGLKAAPAVGNLLMALRDEDGDVRRAAAEALGGVGTAAVPAMGDLVLMALNDKDREVQRAAAEALGGLGTAAAPSVGDLQMALRDEDWHMRRAAAEALGGVGAAAAPSMGDLVLTALNDKNMDVQRAAAKALAGLGEAAAIAVRDLQMALGDEDRDVRRAAAEALAGLGAAAVPAVRDLQTALRDEDKHVRRAAAEALGGLGAAAAPAVGDLQKVLRDEAEDCHVRTAAAEAIGGLGAAAAPAMGDLAMALRDQDCHVRRAAAEALGGLGAAAVPEAGDLQAALTRVWGNVHDCIATGDTYPVAALGRAAILRASEVSLEHQPTLPDFVISLQELLALGTGGPMVAEMVWEWRLLFIKHSPWTLVSAAVAYVVASTGTSLAELLAQPHCIVRSDNDSHQGCKLWTWKLPWRLGEHHSWESWRDWRKWWLAAHLVKCFGLRSVEDLRQWLAAFRKQETYVQVLQAEDVERLRVAAQLYHYATRLETVQKPDLFDPAVLAVFRCRGITVLPAKSSDGQPSQGLQFVSSDLLRPTLVNVDAMEEAAVRALDVTSYGTSPPVPVLRPGWLLIDAVAVSLHLVLLVLMAFYPLALLCISEVSAVPFLGRSPVDGLTLTHFGPRFPQLSSVLLSTSPAPRPYFRHVKCAKCK